MVWSLVGVERIRCCFTIRGGRAEQEGGRGTQGEASKVIGAERKLVGREMAEENDWSGQGWRKRMIGGIPHYW